MKEKEIQTITRNVPNLNTQPAFRKLTLSVTARRFTTDAAGTIIDNALVPPDQQKAYPFHLFGEFDRQGGFNIADSILSQLELTTLFAFYVVGVGTPLTPFNIAATINGKMKKGDLVFVYVDDINAPNYFHWVIVSTNSGGYTSIISQTNITQLDDKGYWGAFQFKGIHYSWIDDSQLDYSIVRIRSRYNGAFEHDSITPEAYRYTQQQPDVKAIVVPMKGVVNQYFGVSSLIAWNNPVVGLTFNLFV